jgi:hypothetical protein
MLAKHHVLNRAKCWILIGGLSASCLGCSVCPSPYDYDYGVIYEGVTTEGIISEGIISEGVISGEPQRVLRSPMRAPLRSQGEIIIE